MTHRWAYHEPRGDNCDCGLPRIWHRVRHPIGCICGASHKGVRSPSDIRRTRAQRRYWVGLDGEGVGRKPHRYVLLAYSDSTGRHTDYVYDPKGLSSSDCFTFLLSLPVDSVACGYYLGYDWSMMLRDLPNRSIYRLLRPEIRALPKGEGSGFSPVRWRGYKLHYLGGSMQITKDGKRRTIWDLGKFYQGPYVDSVDAWQCLTAKDRDIIRAMKEKRAGFERISEDRVREYCLLECKGLAELAEKLEDAHDALDLRPRTWYGPGSTAGEALRKIGIREKRGEQPNEVLQLSARAYFGGRFEQRLCGYVDGPIWSFDIASAYPYHAYSLPCLEHAHWEETTSVRVMLRARHALVRYSLDDIGNVTWGPLPCRLDKGQIVFPRAGSKGWIWRDEFLAAQEGWSGVRFKRAWVLNGDCDCQPFKQVREWYRERVALGKDGKGRVLKLALNSIYGKLAQAVGQPLYGSMVWAGMITSGTRAQLLRLMSAHESLDEVLALATDGIYSQVKPKLPPLPLAPDTLGSWEEKTHGGMLFVRPGVYWGDNVVRARGIGRKTFQTHYKNALEAIDNGDDEAKLGTVSIFHGAKTSVYLTPGGQYRRSPRYGEWCERPVRVTLAPAPKRANAFALWRLPGIESAPYDKAQGAVIAALLRRTADQVWGIPK
jgi:DNA polymerase family B